MYLPFCCPQGALMLFYTARIALLKGDFTFVSTVLLLHLQPELMMFFLQSRNASYPWTCSLQAQENFLACIAAQEEWRQIHHLCYWELMWAYSFELRWKEAYRYADLLCKENKWSQVQRPAARCNCSHFDQLRPADLLPFGRRFMHFKKQPSWACCLRRRWWHWGRMW